MLDVQHHLAFELASGLGNTVSVGSVASTRRHIDDVVTTEIDAVRMILSISLAEETLENSSS